MTKIWYSQKLYAGIIIEYYEEIIKPPETQICWECDEIYIKKMPTF